MFQWIIQGEQKGEFNVPYGKYKNPNICDEERLREASEALQGIKIICSGYKSVLKNMLKQAISFLDPPYVAVGKFLTFKDIQKTLFMMTIK